ncbi:MULTISPECIES: DUF1007 family protein [unclassified Vibrio]|uniref:DUF1007 family protein n=1 Tax=unclassified Vibrio TaxID=2614977 RepID=UPI00159DB649|nr:MULTISPECIES: DUF1007 family protein [unclassified Vibrio]NVN83585.1 DUF1007 family protein [Vibrio sp. Scap16]QLE94270.1 DUF1007 family protein [Vibrio sp. Scap24]
MKQLFILTNAFNHLPSRYVSRFSAGLRSIKRLPLWLALFSFAPSLSAHPHSWIEMKTHIEGEDGMITGFSMEWSFDAMTSMYMLDGEDVSPEKEVETYKNLAASVIENMMYEHYFTYFYDGEEPIKYQVAKHAKFERDKAKMVLTFDLPLSKPKQVTRDSLRVLIFDPSYFVDMSWISNNDVTLSSSLARQCQLEIIEPNPTPEQMSYAMSLPADADPDNTLGQLFTQSVELHCAAVPAS